MRGKVRLDGRQNSKTMQGFPVVFYLTQDSKDRLVLTGFYAFKKDWDAGNALPKKTHPRYLDLLNYLEVKKVILQKVLYDSQVERLSFAQAERMLVKNDVGIFYTDAIGVCRSGNLHASYPASLKAFERLYPQWPTAHITKELAKKFAKELLKVPVSGKKRSPNGVNSYITHLSALWDQVSAAKNPFKGVRVEPQETADKSLNDQDMMKVIGAQLVVNSRSRYGGMANYVNYALLCFYLGGIDLVDLVGLTYKNNVINGRVVFNRAKGSTNVLVSNKIFPQAREIMNIYKGVKGDLVVPVGEKILALHVSIHKQAVQLQKTLKISKKLYTKTARYTFINRAMNLLIDERICAEIVGHKEQTTHSIYKGKFPLAVKDAAHEKIINYGR